MTSTSSPIFVRGLSRSGGTLLCTLLDAHKDVAFSYELYPNLLEVDGELDLRALAQRLTRSWRPKNEAPSKGFATFVARIERGGLSYKDFSKLLHQFVDEGFSVATLEGRLRLIELCAEAKMHRLKKTRWGMKCNNRYDEYLSRWPKACFLNVLRDGRDVLASQLNTGSFNKTPAEVGQGWVQTHNAFEKLQARGDVCAHVVRYEALTTDPEPELRAMCKRLDLEFDPEMLRHSEKDLTVFKARHLSRDRVASAIDTKMIGRWKRDLSSSQLDEFMTVAGDAMQAYGYE